MVPYIFGQNCLSVVELGYFEQLENNIRANSVVMRDCKSIKSQNNANGSWDGRMDTTCNRFFKQVEQMIRMTKESKQELALLTSQVHGLLPKWEYAGEGRINRPHRGLIDPLGDLLSALIGTATHKDLELVQKNLRVIKEYETKQLKLLRHSSDDLASFAQIMNMRVEDLSKSVAERVSETQQAIEKISVSLELAVDYLSVLTFNMFQINHVMTMLRMEVMNVLQGLQVVM